MEEVVQIAENVESAKDIAKVVEEISTSFETKIEAANSVKELKEVLKELYTTVSNSQTSIANLDILVKLALATLVGSGMVCIGVAAWKHIIKKWWVGFKNHLNKEKEV